MSYTIQGFVMLDVDVAALNNAGRDTSSHFDNAVATKKIIKNSKSHAYVSGQAWRYWWRETLKADFGWQLSPIIREKSIAFTQADPLQYPDDDMFGYMRAVKKGTLTRVSPLRNSALISVSPTAIVQNFATMSRQEGDPVPYAIDEYCAVLKGMFSIDLGQAGIFFDFEKTGYKNIDAEMKKKILQNGGEEIDDPFAKNKKGEAKKLCRLSRDRRIKRIEDIVKALAIIHGGAKLTTNFADVTPKLVVLAGFKHGNHPFSHLAVNDRGKAAFSIEALQEVCREYHDDFIGKVYIGRRRGFFDELDADFQKAVKADDLLVYHSLKDSIDAFVDTIDQVIEP